MAIAGQSIYLNDHARCEYEYDDYVMLPIKERICSGREAPRDSYQKMRYVCIQVDAEESHEGFFDCKIIEGEECDGEFIPEKLKGDFEIYERGGRLGVVGLKYNCRGKILLVSIRSGHGDDMRLAIADYLQGMGAEVVEFE